MILPKSFTTVTSLSKILAMILFITLPVLGFWLGMEYIKQLGVDIPQQTIKNNQRYYYVADLELCALIEYVCPDGYIGFGDDQGCGCKEVEQNNNNQTTTTPERVAKQSINGNFTDWKMYTNEEYGFKTKYNPESSPSETIGTETSSLFTYLLTIKFGTNPIKFPNGYEININKQRPINEYRSELIGYMTDIIDSEEEIIINSIVWMKLNYTIFLTTNYIPVTTAITNNNGYSYAITSSSIDIDQILSTFRFLDLPEVPSPSITISDADLMKPENLCPNLGGTYLAEFNECENITQRQCSQLFGGTFDECASSCRYVSGDVYCAQVCVPVCSF